MDVTSIQESQHFRSPEMPSERERSTELHLDHAGIINWAACWSVDPEEVPQAGVRLFFKHARRIQINRIKFSQRETQ